MRKVLVAFAILLAILLLISALGGSLNTAEKFYQEALEQEMEQFYQDATKEEHENYEDMSAEEEPSTATSTATAPTPSAEPATEEPSTAPTAETFQNNVHDESIEPFEDDNTFMPY